MNEEDRVSEAAEMPPEAPQPAESSAQIADAAAAVRAEMERAAAEAAAGMAAQIARLEAELQAARALSARRETEIRCVRFLRERALDEDLAPFLLAEGECEVPDEVLIRRTEALAGAVEAAAVRTLQARAGGMQPQGGDAAPLSAAQIRATPVARLAQILGGNG